MKATRLHFLAVCFLIVHVSAAETRVKFSDAHAEHYPEILVSKNMPDIPSQASFGDPVTSSHGKYNAILILTDPVLVPYDEAKGWISIKANDETVAWVAFSDFKSAHISWINDKLLYFDCNIGHVASVDAILDVENLKWIYRGSKSYNRQAAPSIVGK